MMRQVLPRLSLTAGMVLAVGLALMLMQASAVTYNAIVEHDNIYDMAGRRASAALDMLEAVHVQAMLNRLQTNDGDAAIATLNGAMDQFTEASRSVRLWVVMGPKILAYQTARGEQELEGPRDAVDAAVIASASHQQARSGDRILRVTRPIVLGQGHASHDRCAACHTGLMGIQRNEILGAYSAAVDLRTEFADWQSSVVRQATIAMGVVALTLLLIYAVLRGMAFGPLRRLAEATRLLAGGETAVTITDDARRDELGTMARSLDVFRTSIIANRQLEAEKAAALRSLQTSEARFRDVAEAASDWLWETDADLRLTYVSERFTIITGRNAAELIGKRQDEVLVPVHDDGQGVSLAALLQDRQPFRNLRCQHADAHGATRICEIAGRPLVSADGLFSGYRGTATDVTAEVRAQAQVHHLALHDSLTGLPNRALFAERLDRALASVGQRGEMAAVLCLDLNRFKEVNDTLGHSAGDLLLKAVALRLGENVRETDTVARLGGDEFAIIQFGPIKPADAEELCRRLLERMAEPFLIGEHECSICLSIGVALAPHDGQDADKLLKSADLALHRAKADGRNTYRFFAPGMDAELQARKAVETELRQALARGQLELHYQPLVDAVSQRITGVEALIRWRHPERGMVSPAEFIPIAEATGLILPVGEWVLRTACEQAQAWHGITMSVNLSPVQFRHPGIVDLVHNVLRDTGLDPARLELEITEGVLINDAPAALRTFKALKALGIKIAMDDFGTGYSSLSYLHQFPFDKLKIDQSFIRTLGNDANAAAIIRAIVSLGKSLGLKTTAEGVETAQQMEFLRQEGCDLLQGYYLGRPAPALPLENGPSDAPSQRLESVS